MVIGTFQVPNRDTQQQPLLGNITKKYVGNEVAQEFGSSVFRLFLVMREDTSASLYLVSTSL